MFCTFCNLIGNIILTICQEETYRLAFDQVETNRFSIVQSKTYRLAFAQVEINLFAIVQSKTYCVVFTKRKEIFLIFQEETYHSYMSIGNISLYHSTRKHILLICQEKHIFLPFHEETYRLVFAQEETNVSIIPRGNISFLYAKRNISLYHSTRKHILLKTPEGSNHHLNFSVYSFEVSKLMKLDMDDSYNLFLF